MSGARCHGFGRRNLGLAAVVVGESEDAAQDHGRGDDGGEGGNGEVTDPDRMVKVTVQE